METVQNELSEDGWLQRTQNYALGDEHETIFCLGTALNETAEQAVEQGSLIARFNSLR
jgi:hypothetical protein